MRKKPIRWQWNFAEFLFLFMTLSGIVMIVINELDDVPKHQADTYGVTAGVIAVLSENTMPTGVATVAEADKQEVFIHSLDFDAEEAYLLAKIAMAEAEGEDTEGKALVILTVLNRVWSDLPYFPDTIEEVITEKNAFTPYSNGRYDRVEPDEDCFAALELIQSGWDESQGALYFERNTEESTWHSRNLKKLFVHGNHTFYTEEVDAE